MCTVPVSQHPQQPLEALDQRFQANARARVAPRPAIAQPMFVPRHPPTQDHAHPHRGLAHSRNHPMNHTGH
eukprot:3200962-Karenia_brevis.AAC.1